MKLSDYIVGKYAGILTKEDAAQLFNTLTEKLEGNRSEAARQCDLTGKATYDWEKADYVKLDTRRKVLEACLRIDFLGTLEYLLNRNSERAIDIVRTILSTIYAEAIETKSREQFGALLDKFDTLKIKYRGLIRDQIEEEVADMMWLLSKKALEHGIPLRERLIKDLSAQELLEAIRLVGDLYSENPSEAQRFAIEDLSLPTETLDTILPVFKELSYMKEVKAVTGTVKLSWSEGTIPTEEYLPKIDENKPKVSIVT